MGEVPHLIALILHLITITSGFEVILDGYTPEKTLKSGSPQVPLGGTVILVCRTVGLPYGTEVGYSWTCPGDWRDPCNLGNGKNPNRKIYNDILVINIISPSGDQGPYTCKVNANDLGQNGSRVDLIISGGQVLHSNYQMFLNNSIINNMTDIENENNGRINCNNTEGISKFYNRTRLDPLPYERHSVYQESTGDRATAVINLQQFGSYFPNTKFICGPKEDRGDTLYIYVHTEDSLASPKIQSINAGMYFLTANLQPYNYNQSLDLQFIGYLVGYERLDFGIPIEVKYQVYDQYERAKRPEPRIVPGATYRIRTWTNFDVLFSPIPHETIYTAPEKSPSPPRRLTITRSFKNTIELNWLPPKDPNGNLSYKIRQTVGHIVITLATNSNKTYYNLTGLTNGTTYKIEVLAVNSMNDASRSTSILHNHVVTEEQNLNGNSGTYSTKRPTTETIATTTIPSSCIPTTKTSPSSPSSLAILNKLQDGVVLIWQPPREPNGNVLYKVRYTVNDTEITKATGSNDTYYRLTGLRFGVTYTIEVLAVNENGASTSNGLVYTHDVAMETNVNPVKEGQDFESKGCTASAKPVIILIVISVVLFIVSMALLITLIAIAIKLRNTKESNHSLSKVLYDYADSADIQLKSRPHNTTRLFGETHPPRPAVRDYKPQLKDTSVPPLPGARKQQAGCAYEDMSSPSVPDHQHQLGDESYEYMRTTDTKNVMRSHIYDAVYVQPDTNEENVQETIDEDNRKMTEEEM